MGVLDVECLRCGGRYQLRRNGRGHVQRGDCPRCAYPGWAGAADLDERARRRLRDRPVELRRLRLVA